MNFLVGHFARRMLSGREHSSHSGHVLQVQRGEPAESDGGHSPCWHSGSCHGPMVVVHVTDQWNNKLEYYVFDQ